MADLEDVEHSDRAVSSGILGAVAVYADTADGGDPPGRFGRVYMLRENDALLLAKGKVAPAHLETEEGSVIHVTQHHLYATNMPFVSRHHAVIQMTRGGTSLITDFSTNGIWDEKTGKLWQLPERGPKSQTHVVNGDQSFYVAVDMSGVDPKRYESNGVFRVQLTRFDQPAEKVEAR